ncbi:MAG: sigma-54 dependent transcriptional regulator, partial [Myxococcota bacterium]|nr:sigma-54 dependent transcriptional regulator [Myxococcota bacterium]
HGTVEVALQATRLGALDFIEKPIQGERLLVTVRNALKLEGLDRAVDAFQRGAEARQGMVGDSQALRGVLDAIRRAAPTQTRVLISGESGVGKELVARAIHDTSRRCDKPFVTINCAAIPETLVESELFGHEKGAFSGADRRRPGRFERADGGTLFLDEIGEMPLSVQPRLLRVLQEGEFERVGGWEPVRVDVRIIAATNRDLRAEVEAGTFRPDLFHRLSEYPIKVPPLRERKEDLPALARFFLEQTGEKHGLEPKEWTDDGLAALGRHDWPGNVRELQSVVLQVAINTPREEITGADVRANLDGTREHPGSELPSDGPLYVLLEAFERRVLEDRIARFDGNMTQAAKDLGLERSHLYKKLKRLGIHRDPK